jgi:hypothetical protein
MDLVGFGLCCGRLVFWRVKGREFQRRASQLDHLDPYEERPAMGRFS